MEGKTICFEEVGTGDCCGRLRGEGRSVAGLADELLAGKKG
jgi:hypothetical protein